MATASTDLDGDGFDEVGFFDPRARRFVIEPGVALFEEVALEAVAAASPSDTSDQTIADRRKSRLWSMLVAALLRWR